MFGRRLFLTKLSSTKYVAAFGALVLGAALSAPAHAEPSGLEAYQQRHKTLVQLAGSFGALHHLQRTCNPRREADLWRDRMKSLVELEAPQANERDAMVSAFNQKYRAAQNRYPRCNGKARRAAEQEAARGDQLVRSLITPLYENLQSRD